MPCKQKQKKCRVAQAPQKKPLTTSEHTDHQQGPVPGHFHPASPSLLITSKGPALQCRASGATLLLLQVQHQDSDGKTEPSSPTAAPHAPHRRIPRVTHVAGGDGHPDGVRVEGIQPRHANLEEALHHFCCRPCLEQKVNYKEKR